MKLRPKQITDFQAVVWQYYSDHARQLPWRETHSPFYVVLSEIMLQQTQVSRVIPKFNAFVYTCDSFVDLAKLPLATVLKMWSGLGYNRRAKYLHQIAQAVVTDFNSQLPSSYKQLVTLPGIGTNTAGAILAYAYNQPVVFIETNIRSVLFHHFFDSERNVSDTQLRQVVEQVLDRDNPREWYWALMDYGSHLKATKGAQLTMSRHYRRQTPLEGSLRQMRGQIMKSLVEGSRTMGQLQAIYGTDDRFVVALEQLIAEGLVSRHSQKVCLTGAVS